MVIIKSSSSELECKNRVERFFAMGSGGKKPLSSLRICVILELMITCKQFAKLFCMKTHLAKYYV